MPLRLSKNRVLLDGIPLNEGKASNLASAATIDIWSVTGNVVPITGTATISAFSTAPQAGTKRTLLCIGTPTFTHGANFLLPGSADYIATAGDRIEVLAITTTQFRLAVLRASVLSDVSEYATTAAFPLVGTSNALYLDQSTDLLYRWDESTSAYVGTPFPVDASGNLIASVNHRTGVLGDVTLGTGLLGLAGGVGEISVATDKPALVVHNGVIGGAIAYHRGGLTDNAYFAWAGTTMASGVWTQTMLWPYLNQSNLVSFSPGEIAVPAAGYASLTLIATFTTGTVGTRAVKVEYSTNGGSSWSSLENYSVIGTPSASSGLDLTLSHPFMTCTSTSKFRVMLYQNSGSSLTSGGVRGHFYFTRS